MGVVIVRGPKEVVEGTGLFEGKGALCHCDAAEHATGIKMRKGPQIIDGANLVSTALGAMENPLPNLLVVWFAVMGRGGDPPPVLGVINMVGTRNFTCYMGAL